MWHLWAITIAFHTRAANRGRSCAWACWQRAGGRDGWLSRRPIHVSRQDHTRLETHCDAGLPVPARLTQSSFTRGSAWLFPLSPMMHISVLQFIVLFQTRVRLLSWPRGLIDPGFGTVCLYSNAPQDIRYNR